MQFEIMLQAATHMLLIQLNCSLDIYVFVKQAHFDYARTRARTHTHSWCSFASLSLGVAVEHL